MLEKKVLQSNQKIISKKIILNKNNYVKLQKLNTKNVQIVKFQIQKKTNIIFNNLKTMKVLI